ncbi:MAG: putative quinol monooxygenase [Actinomycetota bacterium]
MIVVSGEIELDPADRDAAIAATESVVAATLQEEGCLTYGFWADPTDPGRFRVFEEWETEAALLAHFGQPHMTAFLETMGTLGITKSEIHRYDVVAVDLALG